jgi:hypothetical protein
MDWRSGSSGSSALQERSLSSNPGPTQKKKIHLLQPNQPPVYIGRHDPSRAVARGWILPRDLFPGSVPRRWERRFAQPAPSRTRGSRPGDHVWFSQKSLCACPHAKKVRLVKTLAMWQHHRETTSNHRGARLTDLGALH